MQNQTAVLDKFLAYLEKEKGRTANTLSAYRTDVRQFLVFMEERGPAVLALRDIRSGHVWEFRQSLEHRQLSVATRARKMASLSSFFQFAQKERWVQNNPAVGLMVSVEPRPPETLGDVDLGKLIAAITGSSPLAFRDKAMITLQIDTGMRPTELLSLERDSINTSECTAVWTSRHSRKRLVTFSESTAQLIRQYVASARPKLLRNIKEQALFLNHRGERLTRQGFWLALGSSARLAGIPDVTSQRIRHTSAVRKLKGGATLANVQQHLGHANYSTTLGYYRRTSHPAATA